ncbi:NAD-dependent epimerase/dehydratase family protein [Synechocystis salina LEGE 06155]|nr:NAD-dependent epimerase/dehydratase family protein [Synechocystis salina LEGE 06155]
MADCFFVTGGTGFVGANLVRHLLAQGYQVRALVRASSCPDNLHNLPIDWVVGDLNDADLHRQMQGCRGLFHVAAHYSLWQKDREDLYRSNVLGTRNILACAQKAGIERTVYTSSVAAIGVKGAGQSADETYQSPVEKLIGAYKQSKYWAEQEALAAAQQGQDIVIVNPSTPIGPWDVKPTPTGEIILRFLRRQMPAYVNTGLNLIDVRDVAAGHLLAWQRGKTALARGDRYILGHENISLQGILAHLSTITGLSAPKNTVPLWLPLAVAWVEETVLAPLGRSPSVPMDGVKMSAQEMYYDAGKAVRELGLPQSSIKQALADAVHWFQDQGYIQSK